MKRYIERNFGNMKGNLYEIVVVFEFVEISLHVAEVAFDVALHHRARR